MTEQTKELYNNCIRGIAEHFEKLVALQTQADSYDKYLDMLNECGAINGYLDILSGELHCIRGARLPWLYAVEDGKNPSGDGKNAREDGENLQIIETK